jgi:branched-chain amino acid transport system substrate-binding protein
MFKQARELGFKGRFVNTTTSQDEITAAGVANMEGTISGTWDWAGAFTTPTMQAFYKGMLAQYGGPFNSFWPYHADFVNIAAQAMVKAQSVDDTDKIRAAMDSGMTFNLLTGPTTFTGKSVFGVDRVIACPVIVSEIINGKYINKAAITPNFAIYAPK